MMKYSLCILSCGVFLSTMTLCYAQRSTPSKFQDNTLKAEEYLYRGILESKQERWDEAIALLRHSYRLEPNDNYTAYQLGRSYLLSHRTDEGDMLSLLRQAYDSDPSNENYLAVLVSAYTSLQQESESIALLEQWVNTHPKDESKQLLLVRMYEMSGEVDKALVLYDLLQRQNANDIDKVLRIVDLKAELLKSSDREAEIEALWQRAHRQYPQSTLPVERLLAYQLNQKHYPQALSLVDELTKAGVDKEIVEDSRFTCYMEMGELDKAQELLQAMMSQPQDTPDQLLGLWYRLAAKKSGEQAETLTTAYNTYFEQLIERYPTFSAPRLVFAEVERLQRNSRGALQTLEPLIEMTPKDPQLWDALLRNSIAIDDPIATQRYAVEAIKYIHSEARYYLYASIGYFTQGKKKQATEVLLQGIEQLPEEDKENRSALYTQLGDIAQDTGDTVQAINYYDEALALDEENADLLNNFAYLLVEQGKDLAKAERLATQAINLDPNNDNVLDTYAWILFKRGKRGLALLYQRKAIEQAGEHVSPVMHDHLGDILSADGNLDEAKISWQKAKEGYLKDKEDDKAREMEQKISKAKP